MDLRELVEESFRGRGLTPGREDLEAVLRDLVRWRGPEGADRILRTADGSLTLLSGAFGEPYHSVSAGAVRECLHKFLAPSGLLNRKGRVRILDVGFGLGYNVAVAFYHLRKRDPSLEIEVVSLERELPARIPVLPEPYREAHRKVLSLLPSGEREGFRIHLLMGDARQSVSSVRNFRAHAVFHDPFSPYRNPELWTLEFLRKVREAMDPSGVWVSYTSSLPVRRALLDLGFRVGGSAPLGRKRSGTVATLRSDPPPLSVGEKVRLRKSPYSVPFRDPDLREDPLRILIEYRISVLLREREVSSEGEREPPPQSS